MVEPLRHRQTKGTATDMFYLTPPRHISTLPWPCENAKTLNRDRRTCSSKTVLVAQRASGFNLEIELKNIILRRVSIFEFLHSQGQTRKSNSALRCPVFTQQRTLQYAL